MKNSINVVCHLAVCLVVFSVISGVTAHQALAESSITATPSDITDAPTNRVVGFVQIQDAQVKDVFRFVSDIRHDPEWSSTATASSLVSGDGTVGSKYQELEASTSDSSNSSPTTTLITIDALHPFHYLKLTQTGAVNGTTEYYILPGSKGSVYFMVDSVVDNPSGQTQQFLDGQLQLSLQNLLQTLGKDGQVTIVQ